MGVGISEKPNQGRYTVMTKQDFISWSQIARNISVPLLVGFMSWVVAELRGVKDTQSTHSIKLAVLEQKVDDLRAAEGEHGK